MDEIFVRFAEKEDAGLITELGKKTFYEAFHAQNTQENMDLYLSQKFTLPQIEAEIEDPESVFFLAYFQTQPIGYAKMKTSISRAELKDSIPIEIERIYVLEAFHQKRAGAALMQFCIDYAKVKGFDTVWLGVWEHNPKAIQFYKRWGFEIFSSYIFVFGDENQTDLLMKKNI